MRQRAIMTYGAEHPVSKKVVSVSGKNFVWWSGDHTADNIEYIEGLTTDYSSYKLSLLKLEYTKFILQERKELNKSLSLAVRQLYVEVLETFLALLFTYLETPDAVPVWMTGYKNASLLEDAQNLSNGIYGRVPWIAGSHSLIRIADSIFSDLYGADQKHYGVYNFSAKFCTILNYALHDYSRETLHNEYNSIKHGHRAKGAPAQLELKYTDEDVSEMTTDGYLNFVSSISGTSFPKISKISPTSKREIGLESVSSTLNVGKIIQRIEQLIILINITISALAKRNLAEIGERNINLPQPLSAKKCWMTDNHEGVIVMGFDHDMSTEGSEKRKLKLYGSITHPMVIKDGKNNEIYAFSIDYTDLLLWYPTIKLDARHYLFIDNP